MLPGSFTRFATPGLLQMVLYKNAQATARHIEVLPAAALLVLLLPPSLVLPVLCQAGSASFSLFRQL